MNSSTTTDDFKEADSGAARGDYRYLAFIACMLLIDFFTFYVLIDGPPSDFAATCLLGSLGGQTAFASVLCAFRYRHWIFGYALGIVMGFVGLAVFVVALEMSSHRFDFSDFTMFLLIPSCVVCYLTPLWMMRATQGWYLVRSGPEARMLEPSSIVHIFAFTLVVASTLTLARDAIRILSGWNTQAGQLNEVALSFLAFQLIFGFGLSLATIGAVRAWFLAKTKARARNSGVGVVAVVWLVPISILAATVLFAEMDPGEAFHIGTMITVGFLVGAAIFYLGLLSLTFSGFVLLSKSKKLDSKPREPKLVTNAGGTVAHPQLERSSTERGINPIQTDPWESHDVFGESSDLEEQATDRTQIDRNRIAIIAIISVIVGSAIVTSSIAGR